MAVKPGDVLGNKYRVDALIGRGGMGHVFAATDLEQAGPPVAIKVVGRVVFDETLMARLRREAEAATRIRSEFVPRVLEVSDTADKEMFLVMDRLLGEPLSQRMRDKGPLPWSEVVQLGDDVLRGLIDAHSAGVVHRDLKPSNVFLAQKGGRVRAMVLDFGVCKLDTVDTEHLTGTGESIGTVAYMAPEQIRGASTVDDRADLYAFGVLVFEMLCGCLPHDGPSQMAILASKLENEPARICDCSRVLMPEGLDALVAKVLLRDPSARFASAQELLKAWRKLGAPDVTSTALRAAVGDAALSESGHDVHNAPTVVHLGPDDETQYGETPVPVDAHRTRTALTLGLSLRKGGGGRVAFALAACALVAGVICVAAFFARGPDAARTGAGATVTSVIAPVLAVTAVESSAAPTTLELDEPAAAESSAPGGMASTPKKPTRVRTRRSEAPKSSEPHITTQPRY